MNYNNMSMHIFHNILWSKYKGGVFTEIGEIALSENVNVQFTQIAETESDRVGLSGVDLTYHGYPYKLMFKGVYGAVPRWKMVTTMFAEVWNTQEEVVLLPGFHTPEYFAMLLAAKLRGKVVGVFCDSTEFDRPRSFIRGLFKRLFFSQCDMFFGYGERSHDYLKMYGAKDPHIYFRCQAAALPHDYDATSVPARRLAAMPPSDAPRYLYVGRMSPEKGLDTLLHAFVQVVHALPKAQLVLVGGGPLTDSLRKLVLELGLGQSVVFAGSMDVDALRVEYLRATCFVLPSTSEPWGLVVNEALSYGCPAVVSHRCGCVPELVINGKSGYVFTAGDQAELADKMQKATHTFADPLVTAHQCLEVISAFTPEAAARQILSGCQATVARKK